MIISNKKISFLSIIFFILGLIVGLFTTVILYRFINPDQNNIILSCNMLTAIKSYNVDFENMLKNKFIHRILTMCIIFIMLLCKHRNKIIYTLAFLYGYKITFLLTIFIKEMHTKGIINYILINFPHEIFYITCYLCFINIIYNKKNISSNNIFEKIAPYINICLLLICGILSESIINLYLVQRLLLI